MEKVRIEKQFKNDLIALAQQRDIQIRLAHPGCTMCDLTEDFEYSSKMYLQTFQEILTQEKKDAIQIILQAIKNFVNEGYECFDDEVLDKKEWKTVQKTAHSALEIFGWKLESTSNYKEIEPGVWKKP